MAARYLINEGGEPFSDRELNTIAAELESLSPEEREKYRDENAAAIAQHQSRRILIVAGPGTGKSHIFKQRVLFWLSRNAAAKILALSFVRKLVADLHNDIQNDEGLTDAQKSQCDIFTLHKYARSVVEQNRGTREWPFAPYFRIIGKNWKEVLWHDALLVSDQKNVGDYSWDAFEKQLHDDKFEEGAEWKRLRKEYFALCQFYNAAGFGDLILRAKSALAENSRLNQYQLFIVDEYQDFNASEEKLLKQIAQAAEGTLTVGDDDQVLYETLKSGKASLIRAIYAKREVVNAMLAFCGRCSFHITRAASHFIKQAADPSCIKKIYLPLAEADAAPKVQVVGCATATTAVDYIRKFIEDHNTNIEQRRKELEEGTSKDAYLLILSPTREMNFYRPNGAKEQLLELVNRYSEQRLEFSEDYYKVLNYYSLASYPLNNLTCRKVLHYEEIEDDELFELLKTCMKDGKSLSSTDASCVKDAMTTSVAVREVLESDLATEEKVRRLAELIEISDSERLGEDLEKDGIDKEQVDAIEHQEEEDAELEEIEVRQMCAVELIDYCWFKGLVGESRDHDRIR
jgi:superfamily I DNA/RNA helicase